ncbi:MAG: type II toxin-antitoxin system RelE/ParE family toxin [Nitrososphaerales archaeon]
MAYSIISTTNFTRGVRKLSTSDKLRAEKVVEQLISDPYSFKELAGKFKSLRSARFGDHRIIYSVNERAKEIILLAIEPRSSVYER